MSIVFGYIHFRILPNYIIGSNILDPTAKFGFKFNQTGKLIFYEKESQPLVYIVMHPRWGYTSAIGEYILCRDALPEITMEINLTQCSSLGLKYDVRIVINVDKACLSNTFLTHVSRPLIIERMLRVSIHSYRDHKTKKRSNNASDIDNSLELPDYGISQLYQYQKQDIDWAIQLEQHVVNPVYLETMYKLPYDSAVYTTPGGHDIFFHNWKANNIIDFETLSTQTTPFWNGGIIAHEVGVGKTAICLGLVKATLDKVKRTLILCPSRLIKQWGDEIEKFTDLSFKAITSIIQYRKIFSKNLLHLDTIDIDCKTKAPSIVILGHNFFKNCNYMKSNLPRVHDIDWGRVIIDEGHEVLQDHGNRYNPSSRLEGEILLLKSQSCIRWVCSATPFNTIDNFIHISNFLQKEEITKYYTMDNYVRDDNAVYIDRKCDAYHHSIDQISKKYICSRTRSSTQTIPEPTFENVLIDMTSMERNLYQTCLNDIERVQLCTHVLISDFHNRIQRGKSLNAEQLKEKYRIFFIAKLQILDARIVRNEDSLVKLKVHHKNYVSRTESLKTTIEKSRKKHHELTIRSKVFNSIEERIETNKICPICIEEWEDRIISVTECGHFICQGCMLRLLKCPEESRNCPICREPISENTVNFLETKSAVKHINIKGDKDGSKMGYLKNKIAEILSADDCSRIIVFSRWDLVLRLISKTLTQSKIKNLFIKGSATHIAKKIERFRMENNIKVLMMSSDKNVSGLNLTEVTHIILLDTVNSHPDQFITTETQAIGRAVRLGQTKTVNIIRIIMKDTIEEDNFNILKKLGYV